MRVWHHSQDLASQIYALTDGFPDHERFGLTSQIRRAAASVPANIAEGAGRNGNSEMRYHLGVAAGSLSELDSHIDLAARVGYVDADEAIRIRASVSSLRRTIYRFQNSLAGGTTADR